MKRAGAVLILVFTFCCYLVMPARATEMGANSEILKCLFVYSNDINDYGYVFAYENGRIAVESILTSPPYNYSLKTNFKVVSNVTKTVDEVTPYISQGYTVFLFNGGQFTSAVNKLAAAHPDLKFLGTSSIPVHNNTAMVMSRNYEWYFLNGLICGMVTKSNKVAYFTVFGTHADPYLNSNAFWYGAKMVNSAVEVHVVSSYSYSDDIVATYVIDELAGMGVDCFAVNQNTQTAHVRASSKGLISCGTSSNTRFSAGEYVFTSGMRYWDDTIFNFIKGILDDNWIPRRTISEGFNESALVLAWWSTMATESQYDNMRDLVEEWRENLRSTPEEQLFCGELATLTGTSKAPGECMTRTEMLAVRATVPGILRGKVYDRESVMVYKYVDSKNPAVIVISTLIGIFCVIFLLSSIHIVRYAHHPVYKASSPVFMLFIMTGMLLITLSCIFWSLRPSLWSCALRPWIAGVGWMMIISALLAKMHRIHEIFTLKDFNTKGITDSRQIVKFMIGMLAGELAILTLWQAISPLKGATKVVNGLAYNEMYYYCSSKSGIPFAIFMTYNTVVLIPVVIIAWITRTVPDNYNESSTVGITAAIVTLAGVIIVGTAVIVKDNILAQYVLPTIGLLVTIGMIYAMIFVPKVLFLHGIWEESSHTRSTGSYGSNKRSTEMSNRRVSKSHTKSGSSVSPDIIEA